MDKPAYAEANGRTQQITAFLRGENYEYLLAETERRGVARNKALNEIIAEHRSSVENITARQRRGAKTAKR